MNTIDHFLKSVQSVKRAHSIYKNKTIYDMGLIILNDTSTYSFGSIIQKVNNFPIKSYTFDNLSNYKLFAKTIAYANETKSWLFVDLQSDIDSETVGILKGINELNRFEVQNIEYNNSLIVDLDENIRIIVCIKNSTLNKIHYPFFIDMFGPVIRI